MVYIEAYKCVHKTWCEYEPNHTADYAVNLGLIMSKTHVNVIFNMVVYVVAAANYRPC